MIQDNDKWYGFTANYNLNQIILFDFEIGLTGDPIHNTFGGSLGLDHPTGLFPILVDGNWYMFVSNYGSDEIIALDFGSNLTSSPSGRSIGNSEYLSLPADLTILRDCERTFGFVLNRNGDIVRMEFNYGIDSIPDFTSLGMVGNLFNPQGISDVFRVGDTLFAFVANSDNNSITRLFFPGCNNASVASSPDRDPPPFTYNAPGNYNISLIINEGMPDQENYCSNITVYESPEVNLGNDTLIDPSTTIILDAGGNYESYAWSNGDTTPVIEVDRAGIYSVIATNEYGCTAEDEIEIYFEIDIPNFFTPNGDGYNDVWNIPFSWNLPDALVQVFDRFGNLVISYRAGEGEWNGTKNGEPCKDDTYWYVIELNKETKPLKGSVTIER